MGWVHLKIPVKLTEKKGLDNRVSIILKMKEPIKNNGFRTKRKPNIPIVLAVSIISKTRVKNCLRPPLRMLSRGVFIVFLWLVFP